MYLYINKIYIYIINDINIVIYIMYTCPNICRHPVHFYGTKKIFISHMITQYIIYLKIASAFIQAVDTFRAKNFNFRFINSYYIHFPLDEFSNI